MSSRDLGLSQNYLYISISDTGEGMPEFNSGKLFHLFRKLKVSSDNVNQQGLGLGLSISSLICKGVIDIHCILGEQLNAKLFVEYSKVKKGSKFGLIIPIKVIQIEDEANELRN